MERKKEDLTELRKSIDTIDNQIIDLLKKRMDIVESVKKYKIKNFAGKNFIRSGREALMLRSLVEKSKDTFSPQAISTIWRMIISTSLSHEQNMSIISYVTRSHNTCYWLAREYYGAFSNIEKTDSIEYIIKNVVNENFALGILPLIDENKKPWWIRPKNEENDIFIFASIPFVKNPIYDKEPVFAIANVKPENTGDDSSIIAINSNLKKDQISILFKKENFDFKFIIETEPYYLIEVENFLEPNDIRIINISNNFNNPDSSIRILGNIAKPIIDNSN